MDNSNQLQEYWISAFRQGEENALAYFFEIHYKPLCYFTRRLTQDQYAAEDIVAEVFVKLWNKHKDFYSLNNVKAFLYISSRNACLDYLKQTKRKTGAQQKYFDQLSTEDQGILDHIIEAEFLQELNLEIEKLPQKCKQIFKMIYFEGLKTGEIAQQLGLSEKTVRSQKARAVELLKSAFAGKEILPMIYLLFQFLNIKK